MKLTPLILLISAVMILESGCSTPRVLPTATVLRLPPNKAAEGPAATAPARVPDRAVAIIPEALPATADAQASELLLYALSMIGVKYRYGGTSMESGFDCSGFVHHVYATKAGINLPRKASDMSRHGIDISLADLAPGDLVFYNTLGSRFSHVGIYVGEGRFVHAPSKRKSVQLVDMDGRYWKRRFNGARRLLGTQSTTASLGGERTLRQSTP